MADDIVKQTYDQFSTKINLGDEKAFRNALKKKETARQIYDQATNAGFNTGDYETFERAMGVSQGSGTEKVQQPKAPQTQPQEVPQEVPEKKDQRGRPKAIAYAEPLTAQVEGESQKRMLSDKGNDIFWSKENNMSFTKKESGGFTYLYYSDGSMAKYLTAGGENRRVSYTAPNGDVTQYDKNGKVSNRIEAFHAPRITSDTGISERWTSDPSSAYPGAGALKRYADSHLSSLPSVDNIYSGMSSSQLRSTLNQLEKEASSLTPGSEEYAKKANMWRMASLELNAKDSGFSSHAEAKRNPGQYAYKRYRHYLASAYNCDLSGSLLDGSIVNNPNVMTPSVVLENRFEIIATMRGNDQYNNKAKDGAYYENRVFDDKNATGNFLCLCLGKALKTNRNPDDIVNEELSKISWNMQDVTEEQVTARAREFMDSAPGWLKVSTDIADRSILGSAVEYLVLNEDERHRLGLSLGEYRKSLSGTQEFLHGMGALGVDTPLYMLGGASSTAMIGRGGMQLAAGRVLHSGLTMAQIGLVGQAVNDLKAGQFSGPDQWFLNTGVSFISGLSLGVAGEGARFVALRPTNFAKVAWNKGTSYGFETAGFTLPEWVQTCYQGYYVDEKGEKKPISGEYFYKTALHNTGVVVGLKGFNNFKGWKPPVTKTQLSSLNAYPELREALEYNLDCMNKGVSPEPLSGKAKEQMDRLQSDMNTRNKGVSWSTYRNAMLLCGYNVTPPAPSAVRQDGRKVQLLDANGCVITENICTNSKKAASEAAKLQKTIEHEAEERNIIRYVAARDSHIDYEACAELADRRTGNVEWRKRNEDGTFAVDENGNYIADENYHCTTPDDIYEQVRSAQAVPEDARTPEQRQLLDEFAQSRGELESLIPDADQLAQQVCDSYGITFERLAEEAAKSPKERDKNSTAAKAMATYDELLTRGMMMHNKPVGEVMVDGQWIQVYNEPNRDDKNGVYFYKDENGKTQMLGAKSVTEYRSIADERAQRYEASDNNYRNDFDAAVKTYREVFETYDDNYLKEQIDQKLYKNGYARDEQGELVSWDELHQRLSSRKAEIEAEASENALSNEVREEYSRCVKKLSEMDACSQKAGEPNAAVDKGELVGVGIMLDIEAERAENKRLAEDAASSESTAVDIDRVIGDKITSEGLEGEAASARRQELETYYKEHPLELKKDMEALADRQEEAPTLESKTREREELEALISKLQEETAATPNKNTEERIKALQEKLSLLNEDIAKMESQESESAVKQVSETFAEGSKELEPDATDPLAADVEEPVETEVEEVETPEAVQPVETDPEQRAKAEAFVDAYFPGLKGDAREARIQETLGSDFEQRVEYDKQDGVNKEKTDAYDAAVAELEKPKTEVVEKMEGTPAEDVAKPSQPTEQAPIENKEKPFHSYTLKSGKKIEWRTQTEDKDGVKVTRVVATADGKEVRVPAARFPMPKEYEIDKNSMPENFDGKVEGIKELRESGENAAATIIVSNRDGSIDEYEVKLNRKGETPKPENEMKPAEVPEAKADAPKVEEKETPEAARDRKINELLDFMGLEGKDREYVRDAYLAEPERLEEEYNELQSELQKADEAPKEETEKKPEEKTEGKKDEEPVAEEEKKEDDNVIVDDPDTPMPTKEVKGRKVPDYSKSTPARTRKFIYEDLGYDKETADGVVNDAISAAKDALKKHKKTEPKRPKPDEVFEYAEKKAAWDAKQAELEGEQAYWEEVANQQKTYDVLNEIREAKTPQSMSDLVNKLRQRYGGSERDGELYDAVTNYEPKNLYEACMQFLASGARFVWDAEGSKKGLKQQTGWGDGERRKMIGMIAKEENGGITPEAAVHKIVDLYGEDLGIGLDQSDVVLNTLLEALQSVKTKGDASAFINARKLAKVEDILLKRIDGEGREDLEADRRADEEFEALKEQYKDELPENPTVDDVANLMERKRQESEEVDVEGEQQGEETLPNETSGEFEAPSDEVPFSLKQEQADTNETVAKDVRERLEEKVGKDLADRIENIANSLGVKVRFTDEDVNGFMDYDEGVLYIGKNLDSDKTEAFVAGHEFTHEMQTLSEGKGSDVYDTFKQAALEWAKEHMEEGGKGYDFDWLKKRYENHYVGKYLREAMDRGMGFNEAMKYAERKAKELVTDDYVNDEIAANVAGRMLENPAIAEDMFKLKEAETPQERRTRLQRILDWIKEYISKRIGNKTPEELTPEEQKLLDLRDKFNDMYNEVVREDLDAQGIETSENGDARDYSVRFLTDEAQREDIIKGLMEHTERSREDVEKWLDSESSLASMILGDPETLDYTPDPRDPAIKKNSDYPQGTVDFSNICRKRKDFTNVYTILQKENPNRVFTALDLEEIRQAMKEDGYTVACGLCFVEDRRQLLGEIAEDFINRLQNNDLKPASQKKLGDDTYVPTIAELITPEGSKKLAEEHPTVWEAFRAHNNARGQQAGRLYEGYNEYKREILNWSDAKVKKVNDAGGLRIFSFSDFEAPQLLDIIQIIQDCGARGVKIQGYTKVPEFAKAVKDTGIKLNQSLIPKGDGVKVVDGKEVLDYDPVEGIDVNDKNFVNDPDNPNVGTILVGINDKQIRLAMQDPFVDYIIPFHSGLRAEIRQKKGIGDWVNYKMQQREYDPNTGKAAEEVNIYTDVLQAAEAEGNPITNKREFVEKFLKVCEERGVKPRFWSFLDTDANGNYIYTEGYHKFLTDFKLFDKEGNIIPQEVVKPVFDDAFNKEILDKYAEDSKVDADYSEVLGKIRGRLGIEESRKTRYEDMAEQYSLKEDEKKLGQGFGSAATSLNQVASAFRKIKWNPGTTNVDIGGGRFDKATDYLKEQGVESMVFDPFNRDSEHNKAVAERVRDEKVDTVTCNNVLNVIDSEQSRANVILQAAKALKEGGTAYFSVYEGDKSGVGRQTKSDSWQNNRPTKDYVGEIEKYFDDVTLKNGVITARNPKPTNEKSVWDFDGSYSGNDIRFSLREEGSGSDLAARMRERWRERMARAREAEAQPATEVRQENAEPQVEARTENGGGGENIPPTEPPAPQPQSAPRAELPPTEFDRPATPIEQALGSAMKVITDTKASYEDKVRARKEIGRGVRDITEQVRNLGSYGENIETVKAELQDFKSKYRTMPRDEYREKKAEIEKKLNRLFKGKSFWKGLEEVSTEIENNGDLWVSNVLRQVEAAQRAYDKATVENVVAFAREMVNSGLIDHEELSRMNELFTAIKRGTGKTPKGLETVVNRMVDIMLKSQERQAQNEISQLLNTKAVKTENGIQKQGAVDLRGQHMLEEMNDWMGRSSTDIGARLADIRDKKNEIGGRLTDEEKLNNADYRDWDDKETGAMLAQRYQDNVESHAENIRQINEDLKVLKTRHKNGEISGKAYTEAKRDLENDLREERIKLIESKWDAAADMNTMITEGRSRAKDFIEAQKAHKDEVLHNGFSDMQRYNKETGEWESTSAASQREKSFKDKLSNILGSTLGQSLSTLNSLLKQLGKNAANGMGYLYKRFAYGWVDCAEKGWDEWTDDCAKLDAKAVELFGENGIKRFTDIHELVSLLPKMEVSFRDGDEVFPHTLDQGQLLYIYCVDKMADGRRNLRFMGIDSDKVNEITEFLDPRLKEMADWLQSDFLVEKRKQYNETYRRMYGADMEAIENYFPLMPDKNQVPRETDIGSPDAIALPSSTTGSMMKRNHKAYTLDLMGSNAIDIVIKHLQDTGRWNNFGEWIRDANTLMSSKRFRNQVRNQHTIYGTGDKLLGTLENTFAIAAGAYKPKATEIDKFAVNVGKGVSASKVTFRAFTAMKQLLSLPAFSAQADPSVILRNMARPKGSWDWCMKNLPLFDKRWQSRKAGDTRLESTELDWNWTRKEWIKEAARYGLKPNAFIDAVTIAIGARSVYDTRYSQYKKLGYKEADAVEKAMKDATIAFNETQQSSEGLFVAPMQVDRSWLAVGLSVFRNASMGYERLAVDGARDFKRSITNGKAMREYMKKMYMRDGMTENMAERAAKLSVQHSQMAGLCKIVTGAFLAPFAWNIGGQLPYLIFGDNGDEKKKRAKDAMWGAAAAGWLEGVAGGNVMSDVIQSIHQGQFRFDDDLMPISSDISRMMEDFFKTDKSGEAHTMRGWVSLANIIFSSAIGVNPQTATDIMVDIFDGINSVTPDKKTGVAPNLGLAKEIALHMMRIMQVPQSQLDQIFIDEINMTAAEAQKLTPKQLASRIAYYKLHKETPMPLAYAYSNDKLLQQVKNKEQQFFTKINEGAEDAASLRVLLDKNKDTDKGKTYLDNWIDALEKEGPTAMLNAREEESAKGNWYLVQRIDKRLNKAEKSAQDEAIDLTSYESKRPGYVARYLDGDQSVLYYDWAKKYEPYSDKKNEVCKKLMALGGERNGKAGHWKYKKNKDKVARGASPKAFNDYYKEHKAEADMCYKFYRIDKEIGDMLSSIDAEKDPQKRDQLISKLMQKILEGRNAGSDKK